MIARAARNEAARWLFHAGSEPLLGCFAFGLLLLIEAVAFCLLLELAGATLRMRLAIGHFHRTLDSLGDLSHRVPVQVPEFQIGSLFSHCLDSANQCLRP
jgi:hypothetical protein